MSTHEHTFGDEYGLFVTSHGGFSRKFMLRRDCPCGALRSETVVVPLCPSCGLGIIGSSDDQRCNICTCGFTTESRQTQPGLWCNTATRTEAL